MDKELKRHIAYLEGLLKKQPKGTDWRAVLLDHRVKIGFFQHERLIHLLITLFFGLLFFIDVLGILWLASWGLVALVPIFMIMSVLYVWHYYLLENGVQKLYRLDEQIGKKIRRS